MEQQAIELKGEMAMQTILHLHSVDVPEILQALEAKRDEAPALFLHSPLVVDCKSITIQSVKLDFSALLSGLRGLSFVPVGIRHVDEDAINNLRDAGWALLRDSNARKLELKAEEKEAESAAPEPDLEPEKTELLTGQVVGNRVEVIKRPVRSGQQVHAPDGDMVILSHTSAGSEVLAAGSVHIYGKLGGRVLAGINGDQTARIFCQSLEAELVSIAGQYQLFDDTEASLVGQPAMIFLDGDRLKIEPIV